MKIVFIAKPVVFSVTATSAEQVEETDQFDSVALALEGRIR